MATDMEKTSWPGWETVRLIGRGSFGTVFEIQRDLLGDMERSAMKVIRIPQNNSDIEELYNDGYNEESITNTFRSHLKSILDEYAMMKRLNECVNIVTCDDVRYMQHDDGIGWDIYIKMELLTPLPKALTGPISEATVVRIAQDMCAALEMCKKHGVVHRDIKPQNIFVSPEGNYKLGDFGIAKTVERTMGGTKIGTYKYMAPEVYRSEPYGSAADIYSLGLVLYWLLNERRMPFMPLPPESLSPGMDEAARHRRFSGEALPEPKNGSPELKRIVLKACAYSPKDRYASASQMLQDLKNMQGVAAAPVPMEEDEPTIVEEDGTMIAPPETYGDSDATVVDVGDDGTVVDMVEDATVVEMPSSVEPDDESTVVETPPAAPAKAAGPAATATPAATRKEDAPKAAPAPKKPTANAPAAGRKSKLPMLLGIAAVVIVALIFLFRGCGADPDAGGIGGGSESSAPEFVMELSASQLDLYVDGTATLQVAGIPEDAVITWHSSNKKIATVEDGVITGVKEGTATITATWDNGEDSYEASTEVTVKAGGVTLSEYNLGTIYLSDTRTLEATSSDESQTVTWESSDSSVVTVENGTITAVGAGSATITATAGSYNAQCTVTVVTPSVTLDMSTMSIYAGEDFTLVSTALPGDAAVSWSSDNNGVATVSDNGEVTAVDAGTASITAKITYGDQEYTAVCAVTVTAPKVSLNTGSKTVYIGDSFSLSATTAPGGQSVTWSSSNTGVATVSGGKVTAVAAGSANITAQFSYGGKTYKATCSVTVNQPGVSLNTTSTSVQVGSSVTLQATTVPGSQSVTWSSSNTGVATVSGGKVTAVAAGSTTITAQITYGGKTYKATCNVTVVTLDSISVNSAPSKTYYVNGEALKTDGLSLKLHYSDGSSSTVSSGFTCSAITATSTTAPVTQTITVTYQSFTTTFTVTVDDATTHVEGVAIETTLLGYSGSGTYTGDWKYGKPNGNGKGTYASGTYTGEWVDGVANGHGRLEYNDGRYYEGEFVNGNATGYGYGKLYDNNGNTYEGEFLDGKSHGQGKCVYQNGDIYEGEWANGKPNGYGKCTLQNGNVYEGDWVNGKATGYGTCYYSDGRVYVGECTDNKPHGHGKMTYPDGTVKEGTWEDGTYVG